MYYVLIVDDEPRIADGMYQLIKAREEFELEIYRAYSGYEALEYLKKTRIDIVLSDICMPGMDGMQLLNEISGSWPECKVIFLTGHSEFEYVYNAIHKLGVNYILKSEGIEVILNALKDAILQLDKAADHLNVVTTAERQMKEALPVLRRDFILNLLEGQDFGHELVKQRFEDYSISIDPARGILLIVGRVYFANANIPYRERTRSLYSVSGAFDYYTENSFINSSVLYGNSYLVWLVQPKNLLQDSNLESIIKGHLGLIQDNCKKSLDLTVSFAMSKDLIAISDIYKEFDMLKNIYQRRFVGEQEMLIVNRPPKETDGNRSAGLIESSAEYRRAIKLLEACLEKGNEKEFAEIFTGLIGIARSNIYTNSFFSLEVQYGISVLFLTMINRTDFLVDMSKLVDLNELFGIKLHDVSEEFERKFFELGISIIRHRIQVNANTVNAVVEQVNKYINENLAGDLSLTRIAEVVFLNPSYLCRFYKQQTGRKLSEYIIGKRIERAKELFYDKKLKINEISGQVGFESPSYFTLCFKKLEKISPQEYRDKLL